MVALIRLASDITDTPGRVLVFVTERPDRKGWTLHGEMMRPAWYQGLEMP